MHLGRIYIFVFICSFQEPKRSDFGLYSFLTQFWQGVLVVKVPIPHISSPLECFQFFSVCSDIFSRFNHERLPPSVWPGWQAVSGSFRVKQINILLNDSKESYLFRFTPLPRLNCFLRWFVYMTQPWFALFSILALVSLASPDRGGGRAGLGVQFSGGSSSRWPCSHAHPRWGRCLIKPQVLIPEGLTCLLYTICTEE